MWTMQSKIVIHRCTCTSRMTTLFAAFTFHELRSKIVKIRSKQK